MGLTRWLSVFLLVFGQSCSAPVGMKGGEAPDGSLSRCSRWKDRAGLWCCWEARGGTRPRHTSLPGPVHSSFLLPCLSALVGVLLLGLALPSISCQCLLVFPQIASSLRPPGSSAFEMSMSFGAGQMERRIVSVIGASCATSGTFAFATSVSASVKCRCC